MNPSDLMGRESSNRSMHIHFTESSLASRISLHHYCITFNISFEKIELYRQCVFSCNCRISPASAAFLHGFCGIKRQESFFVLLCIPVMPEYECISPRPFMHFFSSFSYLTHARYKCLIRHAFCAEKREAIHSKNPGNFRLKLSGFSI